MSTADSLLALPCAASCGAFSSYAKVVPDALPYMASPSASFYQHNRPATHPLCCARALRSLKEALSPALTRLGDTAAVALRQRSALVLEGERV